MSETGQTNDSQSAAASEESVDQYFSSYEDLDVHKLMLEDHTRNFAYKTAIFNNASYIKEKIVMDVGTGTGLLAVFCAQAGAKKVYAVEASNLAHVAKEVVKENKFENIIEVIEGKVEEVHLPHGELVDIIVSEWMGFYLLHEGMLDSVLYARNHFLKPDGHMFPESATIYVAPCRVPTLFDTWESVQGVSMVTVGKLLRQSKQNRPEVATVRPEDLLATEEALCWINLCEDRLEDIDHFTLKHVVGAKSEGRYQGVCVWFDCQFPELTGGKEAPVLLSTSPLAAPTHWQQTVVVLPEEIRVEEGEPIAFQLDVRRADDNPRRYNLELTLLDPEKTEHPTPCSCHMTKCILIRQFMLDHPERDGTSAAEVDNTTAEVNRLKDPEHYSGSDSD